MLMIEGFRVSTVGRRTTKGGGKRPIWTGANYVAKKRKDGVLTWRRDGSYGEVRPGREPSPEFISFLKSVAPFPWLDEAGHGGEVADGPLVGRKEES